MLLFWVQYHRSQACLASNTTAYSYGHRQDAREVDMTTDKRAGMEDAGLLYCLDGDGSQMK